jgi:hypothetical protein
MAKAKKSSSVPASMQEKYDRITTLTDAFAHQHLNEEYAELIRQATAALCRKRPSPLASGKEATWACGITHAIGTTNFLFDKTQTPHIEVSVLYKAFGIAASTGQGKSKLIRDSLNMGQMDPEWCLPSRVADNPMVWMISYKGFILDAREAPRQIQEAAYAKGLIPYIPDAQGKPIAAPVEPSIAATTNALYKLQVYLVDGPMTEKFMKKIQVVSRTILIPGNQTLADLHRILFQAFDREEEHLYEFQIGGIGPYDPATQRYGLPIGIEPDDPTKDVTQSRIDALGLEVGQAFGYRFDFGDDWQHQINVLAIDTTVPKGKFPKITDREGASPPQYADFD